MTATKNEATEKKAYTYAVANQGFASTFAEWMALSAKERQSYEDGAAGIPTA